MIRLWFLLFIGLGGMAILLWLGTWQLQRLSWKEGVLAQINARIAAAPVDLPSDLDPERDRYLPVQTSGRFEGAPIRVLASMKQVGAVHRLIAPFVTGSGRRILVDVGWIPANTPPQPMPQEQMEIIGNLHWPRETDGFTPEPDLNANLWFARDVPDMASALDTEPTLIVLRDLPETGLQSTPMPVDTVGIPNDHLQYAITWFSLAAIWGGMSLLFEVRTRRKQKEG